MSDEYKVKACISDGEIKCACAEEICQTCEYKELHKCVDATIIIGGTYGKKIC